MHKADYFLPVQEIRNVKATTIVQIQVLMHGLKKVGDAVLLLWPGLCVCVLWRIQFIPVINWEKANNEIKIHTNTKCNKSTLAYLLPSIQHHLTNK